MQLNDNEIIIISDDAMDAAYLDHIFSDDRIRCSTEIGGRTDGFCLAGEREIRVTLSRVEE